MSTVTAPLTLAGSVQPTLESLQGTAFICGCSHSGTTLLANIFAAHPDVHIPLRETGIFLKSRARAATMLDNLKQEALEAGKPFLVEKTPIHIRYVDLIREIVANPRFIIPVRDGRDVAASIARRKNDRQVVRKFTRIVGSLVRHRNEHEVVWEFRRWVASLARRGNDHKMAPGIAAWIRDNQIVAQEQSRDDVYVYRHEDLVTDPTSVLMGICDFVGIPYDPKMLEYHHTKREWFGVKTAPDTDFENFTHAELRNWQINQPIFNSAGRWKTELSEADLKPLMEGEGRRLMVEFGYL